MSSEQWDRLSERCKWYENQMYSSLARKDQPLLARLDGRAFHTFTKGMNRPYDERLSKCMIETAKGIVEEFHPTLAYTQSDEITLMWYLSEEFPSAEYPFNGRLQKLVSVLAGYASSTFTLQMKEHFPNKQAIPCFDCRIWSVPTKDDVVDNFSWRNWDARKNSVTMAASSVYSHRELLNKNTKTKLEMLSAKGIDWRSYPNFFRCGTFLARKKYKVVLSEEEYNKIPKKHRPETKEVIRSKVVEVTIDSITWETLVNGGSNDGLS